MSKINSDLIDELLKDYKKPEDIIGDNGLLKQLTKAILERALESELTQELGYEKHSRPFKLSVNARNGTSSKTLKTDHGNLELSIPRDRNSEFEPQIVKKGQRRFTGFDDKIVSMYARGMTTRDIQGHLEEIYGVEVSPELISSVTDGILSEVKEWQNRPLDEVYPIVFFDAIRMKIRDEGHVINKAAYLAIGVAAMQVHDWLDRRQIRQPVGSLGRASDHTVVDIPHVQALELLSCWPPASRVPAQTRVIVVEHATKCDPIQSLALVDLAIDPVLVVLKTGHHPLVHLAVTRPVPDDVGAL